MNGARYDFPLVAQLSTTRGMSGQGKQRITIDEARQLTLLLAEVDKLRGLIATSPELYRVLEGGL